MSTYKKLNMKEPEIFYTDNVVGDQGFSKQVMPSIPKCANGQQQKDPFLSLQQNYFMSTFLLN